LRKSREKEMNKTVKEKIRDVVKRALAGDKRFTGMGENDIPVMPAAREEFGEFYTNLAFRMTDKDNPSPQQAAMCLRDRIMSLSPEFVEKLEALPYVLYYSLTFPMQLFATKVTVRLLNLIGMTAVRQGNMIHLPGYSLEVAEACSGLRSLISLLALGAIYARLTQKGLPRQIILFASTVPIAVAANIFRVFFTAVGAYTVSKELAEDFLHTLSGMMVFVVAFIMLFIFGAILKIGTKKP